MARSRLLANILAAINGVPIGGTTPAAGAFTTLSASGAVSGAGVTARFASPGPIGETAPSTGAFTTLSASDVTTLSGDLFVAQGDPAALSATVTLTAAQVDAGIIRYTGAAGGTLTMPTGSALDTQFPAMPVDTAFDFSIISTVAFAATLAANTGVTLVGAAAVAANTSGRFRLRKTAAATYIVYRL
jgi:hypothetical protein